MSPSPGDEEVDILRSLSHMITAGGAKVPATESLRVGGMRSGDRCRRVGAVAR